MSAPAPVSIWLYRLQSDDLAALLDEQSLNRGRALFTNGSVSGARAQGNQLLARVRDRTARAHQVTVSVGESKTFAICTCYQGGLCEHAAAVLLAWTGNRAQFAWTPPDEQFAPLLVPDVVTLWRGTSGTSRSVSTLLTAQRITDLRKLAQQVGLETEGDAKETIARRLGPLLAEPTRVGASLAQTTSPQRLVLQALALYERAISPGEVERVAVAVEQPSAGIDAALKGLVGLGLAFSSMPSTPAGPGWQVPSDWIALVPPGPLAFALPSQHTLSRSERELGFVTALRALCLLIESQPPPAYRPAPRSQFELQNAVLGSWFNLPEELERLGKRGYGMFGNEPIFLTMAAPPLPVSEATANELAAQLHQSPAAIALMLRLLDQLKLLEITGGRCRVSQRSSLLWELSAVDQARLLATTWATQIQWSEFHDIAGVRLRRHVQASYSARPDTVYSELAALRRAVVRVVRALDTEQTWSVESLLERLRRIGPRLLFPDQVSNQSRIWRLCDRHGGVLDPQQPSDWRLGVVPFVQQAIRQMHLLGLVTTDEDASAVRITALGAFLLGLRADYEPEPSGAVLAVGQDLSIQVAAVDADATLLEQLDGIGEREGFADGRFRYHVTPRTVRDALMRGQRPEEIIELLRRHSSTPLPAEIASRISDWAASFGRTQVYSGVALLELADDLLLPELLRTTSLASALVAQLSPRLLVIDPERSAALWSELVAKGYTPQRVRPVAAGNGAQ